MSRTTLPSLAIAALLLAPAAPRAEEIPAWLEASIERSIPETMDRRSVVFLHSEMMADVSGSTVTSRIRRAFRVTGSDGRGYALSAAQAINDDFKMRGAWKITPAGDVETFGKKAIYQADADTDYRFSMSKLNYLGTNGSRVGDVIAWEYTLRSKPEDRVEVWTFGSELPTLVSRFGIRLPKGWQYRTAFRNLGDLEPSIDDEGYRVW